MTESSKEDLRKGLEVLVGSQKADEVIRNLALGKDLPTIREKQIASQAELKPLPPEQAQAIAAYLGIEVQGQSGGGDKK